MITVRGRAIDKSGILEVTVDNKEANIDKIGNFHADIFLGMGENQISVVALDRFENKATKTFRVIREASLTTQPFAKPHNLTNLKGWYERQYALVVGIDKYESLDIYRLQNAVNDAKAVSRMLKKIGFQVVELYDEKATKRKIIRSFSKLTKKVEKNDSFVFYFAGHGQGFTLANEERVGYIIPCDANVSFVQKDIILYDEEAIPLNTIKKYCKNMKAKHIALLFDSCFSGLAMKRNIPHIREMNIEYYNDLLNRKVINILTAGDDEPVSDGTGHSPFTRAIINGLAKKSLDLHDRDGFATFTQLAVYVKEKVEKATARRQRPQFDNLSMEDGDFIFVLR